MSSNQALCRSCDERVAESCSACPSCGDLICKDCLGAYHCTDCKIGTCMKCTTPCSVCDYDYCKKCYPEHPKCKKCGDCKNRMCKADVDPCPYCDGHFCKCHSKWCEGCDERVCENCFGEYLIHRCAPCAACKEMTRPTLEHQCPVCLKHMCVDCTSYECNVCGDEMCLACIVAHCDGRCRT